MEISIVIVSYNTKDLTVGAVKSILDSNPKVKYEIIVVDNGSTDGSVAAFQKFHFPNSSFHLISNKENLGFAKANNIGIKAAKGEYIFLLNSDTKVLKGSIDKLYQFAKTKSDAGVVVPQLLNEDKTNQGSVFRFPNVTRAIRHYWFKEKILDKYSPEEDVVEIEAAVMAAFLITPKALKKVGLLNEKYFMYYEDIDYCREVKKHNLKVYFLKDAQVMHYHGASGKKLAENKDQWKRLIPSSKIYHGSLSHYLLTGIIWLSQKLGSLLIPLLLSVLLIPTFFNLLRPGYFFMQDDLQAFRVYELNTCIEDFQIPCRWVPDAGYQYGYPQFNYYPPFPYYIGELLHLTGIQYIDSVKILFILGYILSAITMYVFLKSILGRWPGFIGALLYSYIPYKGVEVFVRGALSEFWAQIFFPLILWSIFELIKSGKRKYMIWLALSLAMLLTTHSLMSMIFAPVAIVWSLYWLIKLKFRNITKFIFGGLLGIGLSAFFILPVLMERQFVHLESVLSGYFDYRQHFVSLYKMFISREWGYGSSGFPNEKLNLSLGMVQWVIGLFVLPLLVIKNFKKRHPLTVLVVILIGLTLLSIFMIHMKSSFIWAKLPFLWYLQFPWRYLAVAIFLLCLLVALAIKLLGKYKYIFGISAVIVSFMLCIGFFTPKEWYNISDKEKFSGNLWEKQLTISIFDYLPIYAFLPPNHKAPLLPEVLDGEAKFLDYTKGSNFQKGSVVVIKDTTIRLPLFDFPGMEVRVNGDKITHINNDCRNEEFCFGLITIKLPKGAYKLDAKLTNTPIRNVGNTVTLVSLVGLIVLILANISYRRKAKII
jgi:GT2 family glycosyltransferase